MRIPAYNLCLHVCPGQAVLRCEFRKQFNLDKLHPGTTGRTATQIPRPSLVSHILPAELSCEDRKSVVSGKRENLCYGGNSDNKLVRIGSFPSPLVVTRCEFRRTTYVSMFVRARLSCDVNSASNLTSINSTLGQQVAPRRKFRGPAWCLTSFQPSCLA